MSLELIAAGTNALENPTALYRIHDASGALLYVGISTNALLRVYQHQTTQPWWSEVHRIDLEHFASREAAADAERHAIAEEGPKYNVAPGRRAAVRTRPTAHELYEQMVETHWRPNRAVACINCGTCPEWIPKGELIVEVACPRCGCPTLELQEAVSG